jgi:putative NIF3 family GTP cyclohydrolase 1 type 2
MKVREIFTHFLREAHWVDPEDTADGIESGDPEQAIRRIGVGWSACMPNLMAAASAGCDLFISHEPSFCEYWEPDARFRETEWGRQRLDLLKKNGMALVALHDTWDMFPRYGIRDSWLRFIGLEHPVASYPYGSIQGQSTENALTLHEVERTTVAEFARDLAGRLREFHVEGVAVMGDPDAEVQRVAAGVGCAIPTFEMLDAGADLLIVVYDRAFQTFTRLPLCDLGANLIVIEHGVTEMPGMRAMTGYLAETFPNTEALFFNREYVSTFIHP